MKIETRVWANAGKIPKARGGDEQRLGNAQATSQKDRLLTRNNVSRSREDMRMAAVKMVPRVVVQQGSRTIEDDGKAKRKLAPG